MDKCQRSKHAVGWAFSHSAANGNPHLEKMLTEIEFLDPENYYLYACVVYLVVYN